MTLAARAREEFFILDYEDPSEADEETFLIIEEWLEANDYLFEFEEKRSGGKRMVILTIYLWI